MPQDSWQALQELRRGGRLWIHAGRILALHSAGRRIRVTWCARGETKHRTLLVDRVVNCTGPDYDVRRTQHRLLRSLVASGMACPDPLGLGLLTDEVGALTDAGGRSTANLYYVGPMLRGAHWETTAVPELREHAARLVRHLRASRPEHSRDRLEPRPAPVSVSLHG